MSRSRTERGKKAEKSSRKRSAGTSRPRASAKTPSTPGNAPRSETQKPVSGDPYRSLPRPPKKHPREMTTDEAMEHLFHPDVIKQARHHANAPRQDLAPGDPE